MLAFNNINIFKHSTSFKVDWVPHFPFFPFIFFSLFPEQPENYSIFHLRLKTDKKEP